MLANELKHFRGPGTGDAFERWRVEYGQNGYFLNVKSTRKAMLHHAGCSHFTGSLTADQKVMTEKVCSTSKLALKSWAFRTNRDVANCDCL